MNSKRISLIFVILLLALLLVPMLYLQNEWGFGFGWLWGFNGSYWGFEPIWEAFKTGFPPMSVMFYLALAAVIGIVVDAVLLIIAIKATSHRQYLLLTALLNVGFGVTVILVTTIYSIISGSIFISPSAIVVVIIAGIAYYQIQKA